MKRDNSTTRRSFLQRTLAAGSLLLFGPRLMTGCSDSGSSDGDAAPDSSDVPDVPDTPDNVDGNVTVYRAVNGSPAENMAEVVHRMGGIDRIIGPDDVVIIKPNVQWWNQGAPNLAALKTFIDLILDRPGLGSLEVVLAENCHRGPTPWESTESGWTRSFQINSDLPGVFNFNDLSAVLKDRYGERFSTVHWINVENGGQRIYTPDDGPGYVYCDGTGGLPLLKLENGADGGARRATIMTYPVFLTDNGTLVDFKHGVWDRGRYTDQPVKFINFAAMNHHSTYCGMTSAIKNYLGVSDLSGGADPYSNGRLTDRYYNFHAFPFNGWSAGPVPGMIGAEIATFLNTVRRADLNITTAEWIGLGSRVSPPVAHTRAVLASTDPVALDYHSAKYLMYPNSRIRSHDPDDPASPVAEYLRACAERGGGVLDESRVSVVSYDFGENRLQERGELVRVASKTWGTDPKTLMKYILFRYANAII